MFGTYVCTCDHYIPISHVCQGHARVLVHVSQPLVSNLTHIPELNIQRPVLKYTDFKLSWYLQSVSFSYI
jgi:hypothetical protein